METGNSRLEFGQRDRMISAGSQFPFSDFQFPYPFSGSQKIVFPAVPSLFSPPMLAEEMNIYCARCWAEA